MLVRAGLLILLACAAVLPRDVPMQCDLLDTDAAPEPAPSVEGPTLAVRKHRAAQRTAEDETKPGDKVARAVDGTVEDKTPPPPPLWVYGSVRDEAGRPVAEAAVTVLFFRRRMTRERRLWDRKATTDAHGAFRVNSPPDANIARCLVRNQDWWVAPPVVEARRGSTVLVHELGSSRMAYDEDGRPAVGEIVSDRWPELNLRVQSAVTLRGWAYHGRSTWSGTVEAHWRHGLLGTRKTKAKVGVTGRFKLRVPRDACELRVGVPAVCTRYLRFPCGHKRGRPAPRPGIWVHDVDPHSRIELHVPLAHSVEGGVQLRNGTPIEIEDPRLPPPPPPPPGSGPPRRRPILTVWRMADDGVETRTAITTRANGRFTIDGLAAGRYLLRVEGDGVVGRTVIDVPQQRVTITCAPPFALSGRVDGEHTDGFFVSWFEPGMPQRSSQCTAKVGTDGRFTLKHMHGGGVGTLHAWRPGDTRYGVLEHVDFSMGPVRLRLREGRSITGRIEGLGPWARDVIVIARAGPIGAFDHVDSDGGFALVGLPEGRFDLEVEARTGARETRVVASRRGVDAGDRIVLHVEP